MTVLGEALKQLRQEYATAGKTSTFEALKAFLDPDNSTAQRVFIKLWRQRWFRRDEQLNGIGQPRCLCSRILTIINQTKNITNITYNNNVINSFGPQYQQLAQVTNNRLERYRINYQQQTQPNAKGNVSEDPVVIMKMIRVANADRSALMRSFRKVEKQDAQNQVERQKLHALKPIGFTVTIDLKNQMYGDNHRHNLRHRKLQIHWLAEYIREKDEHRCDKERDL